MARETGRISQLLRALRGTLGVMVATAVVVALISTAAQAADTATAPAAPPADYHAPTGFNGHPWKTPFRAFKGFHLLGANTALASHGKVVALTSNGLFCGGASCPAPPPFAMQTEVIEGTGSFALDEYGEPPNFQRHGRILVDPNGDDMWPVDPQAPVDYVLYRWCGLAPSARTLHPACPATVTFVFNETRGVGMVLYATNPVYDYAYARHMTGDDNNDVYVILNSPRLELPYQRVVPHMTSHIHSQQMTVMTADEYREFEP